MNARRATVLVLMLGVFASALLLWVQASRSTRESHLAVIAERGNRSEIARALRAAQARSAAAETASQELELKLKKARETSAPAAVPATPNPERDDPQLQLMRLRLKKAKYAGQYAAFYSRTHPTREQIDRLETALAQRDEMTMDIQATGFSIGAPVTSAMNVLTKSAADAFRTQVEQLLGTDGARVLAEYERTLPARDCAAQFASSAVAASVPVDRDTVERVIEVICKACPDHANGKAVDLATVDWTVVDQQAQQLMTPAQFRQFTKSTGRVSINFSAALRRALTSDGLMPAD